MKGEDENNHMHGIDVCAYCVEGDVAKEELARQEKEAKDPCSIYGRQECEYRRCSARAEYIVKNSFGVTILLCEKHYEG